MGVIYEKTMEKFGAADYFSVFSLKKEEEEGIDSRH